MGHAGKTLFILLITAIGQMIVYVLFISPFVLGWGATDHEKRMPMPGDDMAPYISSTRAINIDAPVRSVWELLTGLGADRNGFYSYVFIEKALGYETLNRENKPPGHYDMKVGRIVPGSMNENKSAIEYNFPVVYVDPQKALVLKNWGTFFLKERDRGQTRLILRTHGQAASNIGRKISKYFLMIAHYLMERRMMLGIKARAEAGNQFNPSATKDILWFLGIVLSAMGILLMALMGGGGRAVLLCPLYGILWLGPLLVFPPKPVYSLSMLLLVLVTMLSFPKKRKRHLAWY